MKRFVINVLGRGAAERIIRLLAAKRQYWMLAIIFRCLTRRMRSPLDKGGRKRYRVLMIDKDTFYEDVLASLGASPDIRVYVAHRILLKALAAAYLPPELDDNFYVSDDPKTIQAKENYGAFLAALWERLSRILPIDAVVTANFCYYAEREFAGTMEAAGIPFLALHKENLKSPGRMDFFTYLYRTRRGLFTGRRILVYNEIERVVQTQSGIISPDRVTICGMPRLDRMHAWRRNSTIAANGATDRDKQQADVLFFSFIHKTGLPQIRRKSQAGLGARSEQMDAAFERLSWDTLFRDTHEAIYRFAENHPDVSVVIKTKPRSRDYDPVLALLGPTGQWPGNLKLVCGGDPFDLIVGARAVCGFNTTGLFEAITGGKPVIVPNFAEAKDPEFEPFIVDFESAVTYATSPDDLIAKIEDSLKETPISGNLPPSTLELLDKWTGNADGKASQRVTEAVIAEMDASREA